MQNFTSDRKLLLDAVHKAIPRFPPHGREYLTDFDTLQSDSRRVKPASRSKECSLVLRRFYERILMPDAIPLQNDAAWRDLYDELDQERIAIYPIDARGLDPVQG